MFNSKFTLSSYVLIRYFQLVVRASRCRWMEVCLSVSVSLSVRLYVSLLLSVCLFVTLSVILSVCQSHCMSVTLYVSHSVCLSVRLFVSHSVWHCLYLTRSAILSLLVTLSVSVRHPGCYIICVASADQVLAKIRLNTAQFHFNMRGNIYWIKSNLISEQILKNLYRIW